MKDTKLFTHQQKLRKNPVLVFLEVRMKVNYFSLICFPPGSQCDLQQAVLKQTTDAIGEPDPPMANFFPSFFLLLHCLFFAAF